MFLIAAARMWPDYLWQKISMSVKKVLKLKLLAHVPFRTLFS